MYINILLAYMKEWEVPTYESIESQVRLNSIVVQVIGPKCRRGARGLGATPSGTSGTS